MLLIPLRTDSPIRATPMANYALIGVNVALFLFTYDFAVASDGPLRGIFMPMRLMLHGAEPQVYQLFTYQFLHDGWQHLLGNMLFLWVFGNSVNAKMGDIPYLLFYLTCGVIAGIAYMMINSAEMLGASGAIAGVTTAFLVLFPRSRTSFFYWFFVIGYFELPSMILIVAKVIVYDNLIAPMFGGAGAVAYSAHIAGYVAGFAIAMFLLWIRAVPRDQFDLLALWNRARRRRAFAQAVAQDPHAEEKACYGMMARTPARRASSAEETEEGTPDGFDAVVELRGEISDAIRRRDYDTAAEKYRQLIGRDPKQVLARQNQLDLGSHFMRNGRHAEAVEAYEKYLAHYPRGENHEQVRLMLGVIYAKYLGNFEQAERHLLSSREILTDSRLIDQCNEWLSVAARALGRPKPESG